MGAQSDVEMEDAFHLGLDPLEEFLREPLEVFAVFDPLLAAGASGAAVDEEDFDVGGVAQFAAAELALAQDGKGAGFLVRQLRGTVLFLQFGLAVAQAAAHDDFGQFGESEGEVGQAGGFGHVFHVDAEQLLILEPVQGFFSGLVGLGLVHELVEFLPQRGLRLDERGIAVMLQQRQEVAVLAAQEVFPQKVAGAEQAGEEGEGLLVAEEREGLLLGLALGVLYGEVEELIEGFEGFGRVWRPGQGMGKLLDEDGGQPQVLLIGRVGQFLSVAVADVEAVVQLAAFDGELRLVDIDVAHGERVGEGIQKCGRVVGLNVHHRVGGRLAVVERDVDGMEQAAERAAPFAQLFDQLAIHGLARFVEFPCIELRHQGGEFADEPPVILRPEGNAAPRLYAKDIHDLFPAQARPAFRPGTRAARVTAVGWCRRGAVGEGIDLALFDVQPEGGEEAADVGKGGKVVVGDEGQIEMLIRPFCNGDFAGMIGSQVRGEANVPGDDRRFESAEVFPIHAAQKILKDIGLDVGAEGTHRLLELFIEGHRDRILWLTGPQYTGMS